MSDDKWTISYQAVDGQKHDFEGVVSAQTVPKGSVGNFLPPVKSIGVIQAALAVSISFKLSPEFTRLLFPEHAVRYIPVRWIAGTNIKKICRK